MRRTVLFGMGFILCALLVCIACSSGGSSGSDGDIVDGDTDTERDTDSLDGDDDLDVISDGDSVDGDLDAEAEEDGEIEEIDEDDADGDHDLPEEVNCVDLYGEGWAFNPSATEGDGCKDCSTKVCPPESSHGIYHRTTLSGRCVCETLDGYFFSDTTFLPMPCDADRDGWTTITAKEFVESDDEALRTNARCDVRTVDRFVLHPEQTEYAEVEVDVDPMPLYEPNNRDEQSLLDLDTSRAPAYGENGRYLLAEELNSLTKFCVNALADYNGNGVGDVAEWPGQEQIDGLYAVYAPFAYFGELNHGWYDPNDGAYHIAENPRRPDAEAPRVPVVTDSGSDYWQECSRLADAAYDPDEPSVGMDFASYLGMFHHSQFKCLQVVDASELSSREPQKMTPDQVAANWRMNACRVDDGSADGDVDESADGDAEATADGDEDAARLQSTGAYSDSERNPLYPEVTCDERSLVNVGDVGLALASYVDYSDEGGYTRGCVNECVEGWDGISVCNGYEAGTASCDTETEEFGSGTCGCAGNYSYPECTSCIDHFSPESNCTACYDTDAAGHWAGARCDHCRGNWNLSGACKTCINHYTPASDCTTCYDTNTAGHWTGSACDECQNHYALASNCKSCETNYTLASACTLCTGNFDEDADCLACEDDDTDGHWSGETCDQCSTNYYTGQFDSSNLVLTPNGNQSLSNWQITGNVTYAFMEGYSCIQMLNVVNSPIAMAVQVVDLDYALPYISDSTYTTVRVDLQAIVRTVSGNVMAEFDFYDRAGKKLNTTRLGPAESSTWTTLNATLELTEPLRNARFVMARLIQNNLPGFGFFRGISLTVHSDPNAEQQCMFCKDGWTDDPTVEGQDCLKCPSTTLDSERWNAGDACRTCADDNTNGHWDMPNCSECKHLWSNPGCNVCMQGTFEKDSEDQCSRSVTLVSNGGAEDLDMSAWNSNIPLTRHTSMLNIDSAARGQYFFSMKEADGEKNPYAEQRVTLSQTLRDALAARKIGYLVFSVYLAAHTENDSPTLKVYQVTTPGEAGTLCTSTSTNSESWVQITRSCSANSNTKELRIRLEGENDNGGACNAYWDDIQVFYTSKLPELL